MHGKEKTINFRVEHVFIATPIDVSREKRDDEDDTLIWSITTGLNREKEGGEKNEEEKEEEIFGFGKLPNPYHRDVMTVK